MRLNDKYRNFTTKLKVIIRYYNNSNNETTEYIVTDEVITSSTLIGALKFLFRNTSIPIR